MSNVSNGPPPARGQPPASPPPEQAGASEASPETEGVAGSAQDSQASQGGSGGGESPPALPSEEGDTSGTSSETEWIAGSGQDSEISLGSYDVIPMYWEADWGRFERWEWMFQGPVPPLLLLPMRLEYRVVDRVNGDWFDWIRVGGFVFGRDDAIWGPFTVTFSPEAPGGDAPTSPPPDSAPAFVASATSTEVAGANTPLDAAGQFSIPETGPEAGSPDVAGQFPESGVEPEAAGPDVAGQVPVTGIEPGGRRIETPAAPPPDSADVVGAELPVANKPTVPGGGDPPRLPAEIRFRWYPDEGFVERGVAPISDDEMRALEAFGQTAGNAKWLDMSNPAVATAWQTLASAVGPYRALALLRERAAIGEVQSQVRANWAAFGDPQWKDRAGRIVALPTQVVLFALRSGVIRELGRGARMPAHLEYTPGALEPGQWLASFDGAVAAGMGMRLTDPAAVQTALGADWIIAVGLYAEDAVEEMTRFLKDAVANGTFALVPQNAPTNNRADVTSAYAAPRAAPLEFLAEATHAEQGRIGAPGTSGADVIAAALGLPPDVLRKAVLAANGDLEDAKAMVRVVGPVLLDNALASVLDISDIDEGDLVEFFAGGIVARGALPAVRFGNNPYGVLPVSKLRELEPASGEGSKEEILHNLFKRCANLFGTYHAARTEGRVPVIAPGTWDAAGKLTEILQHNPVSRRINVAAAGDALALPLACPFVTGAGTEPQIYLADLATKPLSDLPDPDETDASSPLLYRLARMAVAKTPLTPTPFPITGTQTPTTVPAAAFLTAVSFGGVTPFAQALRRLRDIAARKDGSAQLEALLLETIDLFQHRADAWAMGLCYRHLTARRQAGVTGLRAGYFALLGKLRPQTATGTSGGYIQAPTMAHATTAALLRAAYLRSPPNGAFAINLPSRRLRRALKILELLQRGLSLPEILGLRGERWLHDHQQDSVIALLRAAYPFKSTDGDLGLRLFNGLDLVHSTSPPNAAIPLKNVLADDLDALADLVMCEAVHQRALGQAARANAWLQVLSGHPVPGDPMFARMHRQGQGSTHRVAVVLTPVVPDFATASPRAIAEPTLARLAAEMFPRFDVASVRAVVTLVDADGVNRQFTIGMRLSRSLHLEPLDLVIGDAGELSVRVRNHVIRLWQANPDIQSALGPLPLQNLDTFLKQKVSIALDIEVGVPSVAAMLADAALLRNLIGQARGLEPSDLNAATGQQDLEEPAEARLLNSATAALVQRATALQSRLASARDSLANAASAFVASARDYGMAGIGDADANPQGVRLQALVAAGRVLDVALDAASRFSEPTALRSIGVLDAARDPDALEERLAAILARLDAKIGRLQGATSDITAPMTLRLSRPQLVQVTTAIKDALDGEALPILPPVAWTVGTFPALDAVTLEQGLLAEWQSERSAVSRVAKFAKGQNSWRAFAALGRAAATAPNQEQDTRGETEAPRVHHFGVFIAPQDTFSDAQGFAGFVVDEWAEQRPSANQMTGLAVNYDSPQSEPAQCLLLCEPPRIDAADWSAASAADMVAETIHWMKVRAVSAEARPLSEALFPGVNEVASKEVPGGYAARLPVIDVSTLNSMPRSTANMFR